MPVKYLGKGRKLTIKRIRMASNKHAQGSIEQAEVRNGSKMASLHALVDFDNYHYFLVDDSAVECQYVVGIPNHMMPGPTNETSLTLIEEYSQREVDYCSRAYTSWLIKYRAKSWAVKARDIIYLGSEFPEPDIDRIYIRVLSSGQPKVQYGVAQHKRFKQH